MHKHGTSTPTTIIDEEDPLFSPEFDPSPVVIDTTNWGYLTELFPVESKNLFYSPKTLVTLASVIVEVTVSWAFYTVTVENVYVICPSTLFV